MDKIELLDELRIKKAASLADSEAPVRQDTERARNFVRETLKEDKSVENKFSRFSLLFKRPVYVWGGIGAIAVAGLALVLTLSPQPTSGWKAINPAMTSVHASVDSLETTSDTLTVEDECIEIIPVEQ